MSASESPNTYTAGTGPANDATTIETVVIGKATPIASTIPQLSYNELPSVGKV
jgi:hypothetical protein